MVDMHDEGNSDDGGQGVPINKVGKPRTRVSRACDRCRSKKDKCDGKRPACSACIAGHHVCIYDPSTKKRGLPEGYVRGIEKLWALAIGRVSGLEDTISTILNKEELLNLWNHDQLGDDLHEKWKNSKVLRGLEDLLTKLETTNSQAQANKAHADEATPSSIERSRSFLHQTGTYRVVPATTPMVGTGIHNIGTENGLHRLSAAADILSSSASSEAETTFPPRKRQRVDGQLPEPAASNLLSLPVRATKMLDFYFSYTHCWLPIVERHQVLKTTYAYSDGPIQKTSVPSGDHAALWAMLALSSHQYSRAVQIANPTQPPIDIDFRGIYATARGFIPQEHEQYTIGHVQALLLLALVDYGLGRLSASWTLMGQAVRVAIELDLSRVEDHYKAKSLFLSCFVLDTIVSARLGRQPHLRSSDAVSVGRVDENGLEEWDPWKDYLGQPPPDQKPAFVLSTFNCLVQVFMVLNDVICSPPTLQLQRNQEHLSKLHEIAASSRDLRRWLQTSQSFSRQPVLPHQMVLLLHYKTTELVVQMRSYPHLNAFESPERMAPQPFHDISSEILGLFTRYETNRFLFLLPSTSEYTLRSAFEAAVLAKLNFNRSSAGSQDVSFATWLNTLSRILGTLQLCWSGYHSLRDALDKESYMTELMSPMMSGSATYGNTGPRRPSVHQQNPSTYSNVERNSDTPPQPSRLDPFVNQHQSIWANGPSSIGSTTSGLTPKQIAPNIPEFAQSLNDSGSLVTSVDPSLAIGPMTISGDIAMPAGNPDDQATPCYSAPMSMDMTHDLDAIFDDLAQLDTTDWAIEREHAFKDFGFSDELTFRAFCNDPERLNPSGNVTPFTTAPSLSHQEQQRSQSSSNSLSYNQTLDRTDLGNIQPVLGDVASVRHTSTSNSTAGSSTNFPSLPEGVGW